MQTRVVIAGALLLGVLGAVSLSQPSVALAEGEGRCTVSGESADGCGWPGPRGPSTELQTKPGAGPSYDETVAWLSKTVVADARREYVDEQDAKVTFNDSITIFSVVDCGVTWEKLSVLHTRGETDDTAFHEVISFDMRDIGSIFVYEGDAPNSSYVSFLTKRLPDKVFAKTIKEKSRTDDSKRVIERMTSSARIDFPSRSPQPVRVHKAFLRLQQLCAAKRQLF